MEKQNYIGRKVKGFSFVDTENCSYVDSMNKYIGLTGIITRIDSGNATVNFGSESWCYPLNLIDKQITDYIDTELRDQFAMHAMNGLLMHYGFR